ncbi:hypothetical protein OG711_08535 [Streptomyces uncialis]|uniref:hypothetical protein n=1 Tax=Streptomyces uncialis TaxID=1048205 RepID=UPI002255EA20|nr:hypothetical protein [Streptomyces uncialis]MCX4659306.1 hypothetical protein [Streptomyces uncialis]
MARPPSAAQLRMIAAAESVTGRLRGTPAQLAALGRLRLAFRHPRPPHDWFLTPAGHRLREAPRGAEPPPVTAPAADPGAPPRDTGVFAARVGGEAPGPGGPGRAREVHSAWAGLLEMRRMTHTDGSTERPCGWERTHLIPAAALALEAAGRVPRTTESDGYEVAGSAQPEAVTVRAGDSDGLRACADALTRAGWQVSEHQEPRTGHRYLLASPRRV